MANTKRDFKNLKLPKCCQEVLEDIKKRQEIGQELGKLVSVSPFISIFGGGSVPELLQSLVETDWEIYGKAVKAVPIIVRRRCADVAGLHLLQHPGGDLNRFWTYIYESFTKP
jgi:uncharacterized protein with von Willebrand factor type A (vWA) domain